MKTKSPTGKRQLRIQGKPARHQEYGEFMLVDGRLRSNSSQFLQLHRFCHSVWRHWAANKPKEQESPLSSRQAPGHPKPAAAAFG